jgi:hypothetical protein
VRVVLDWDWVLGLGLRGGNDRGNGHVFGVLLSYPDPGTKKEEMRNMRELSSY